MDEYANEDGVTAPVTWPGSFQRAMLERLLRPDRRRAAPAGEPDPLPDHRGDRRLQRRGSRSSAAPTSATAASAGAGTSPSGSRTSAHEFAGDLDAYKQAGRAPGRAAPDDDHAERAALVRRRLVVGAAEGEHDRPARDPRRQAPQLLARRRPRRRRLLAALHRAAGRARPRVGVRAGLDPADGAARTTRSSAASPTTSRSTWRSGGGGIRTHGTLARPAVFKTAPFDRSGTPPRGHRSRRYCSACCARRISARRPTHSASERPEGRAGLP